MSLLESRDYYKPFQYEWAYTAYRTAQSMHWLPHEAPMGADIRDWNVHLTANEKSLLTQLFRFFTQADCFHPDTEILTQRGWVHFPDLRKEDVVAQVHPDGTTDFVKPVHYVVNDFEGELLRFSAERVAVDHMVTPNHKVVYRYKDELRMETASTVKLYQRKKLMTGALATGPESNLTTYERILIAFQADGNVKEGVNGKNLGFIPHRFSFKKPRKIERLRSLLLKTELHWEESATETPHGPYTTFYVGFPEKLTKNFEWVDFLKIDAVWASAFIDEIAFWDGTTDDWGNQYHCGTRKSAADVIQAVAALSGRGCYLRKDTDIRSEKFNDTFNLGFGDSTGEVDCQHVSKTSFPYTGKVYCVTVPSGMVLVRANGKTVVSGNCDIARGYFEKYAPRFPHPEIRMMIGAFIAMEANHIDAYSTLIDTLGLPEGEYKAFQQYAAMRKKHEYMFEHESGKSIADLAVDIAIFSAFGEGMQLFSSFAILLSFQKRGLMKGMTSIVEWSARDESHHVESMLKLFHQLIKEHPRVWNDETKKRIHDACRDMVKLEDAFIDQAFSIGPVDGITPEETKKYIRYIADRRLLQLGLKPNYRVKDNPLPWLDWIMNAPTHTNFFEQRSTEYGKGEIEGWDKAFNFLTLDTTPKYLVYTMPDCPHCAQAKDALTSRSIPYRELLVENSGSRALLKAEEGDWKTFPMIYRLDSQGHTAAFVGGADALIALLGT